MVEKTAMMIKTFQTFLHYTIWSCVLIIPLELSVIQLVFWLLLLNFLLEKEKWHILRQNKVFILLLVQYPVLVSLRIFLTPVHDYEIITYPAEYQMWIYCTIGILVATIFFGSLRAFRVAKVFLFGSLFITFVVAAYQFHVLGDPKVKLFNTNVFQAPLFATMIGIILFSLIRKDTVWIVAKTISIFAPLLVLSITYAGTRGIFIGQIATLTLGITVFLFLKKYQVAIGLLSSLFLGVSVGFLLNGVANGSFATRLDVIFLLTYNNALGLTLAAFAVGAAILAAIYAFQKIDFRNQKYIIFILISLFLTFTWAFDKVPSSGVTNHINTLQSKLSNDISIASTSDTSTAIRLQFLKKGLIELEGHFLTGRGVYIEPYIAREVVSGHKHLHNNYLSWLLWGGVLILVSGLIWLISPLALIGKHEGLSNVVFPLMTASFWLVALLFDSFFAWQGFTYAYAILICLAYQSFRSKNHENALQIGTIG